MYSLMLLIISALVFVFGLWTLITSETEDNDDVTDTDAIGFVCLAGGFIGVMVLLWVGVAHPTMEQIKDQEEIRSLEKKIELSETGQEGGIMFWEGAAHEQIGLEEQIIELEEKIAVRSRSPWVISS